MNFRLLLVFILIITTLTAADNPEKVYRIVYVQKPNEWYQKQAVLWNKVLSHNPANEEAWMNFYKANRYARFENPTFDEQFKQKRLDSIITEMRRHIPDTYTYFYLKALNAKNLLNLDISELEQAHKRWPKQAEILYELITYFEITGEKNKVLQYSQKLYASEDIARGLLDYNANMLLSTRPNAIVFTNGDNDTYPAWLLQNTQKFRTDVTIINVHLAFGQRNYLERLLSEKILTVDTKELPANDIAKFFQRLVVLLYQKYENRPIYMAATVNQTYINPFKKDLYLVGLVYRYNISRMKNLDVLRANLENTLHLDYLLHDWYEENYPATSIVKKLNGNYIPLFMNLAEHYQASGDAGAARRWKNRAQDLAKHIGSSKLLEMVKNKAIE
jgi:hypothetical protein